MSETGVRIFNVFFSVGAEVLYAACLTLFFRAFMKERGHWRRRCVIVFGIYLFGFWIYDRFHLPQGSFTLILIMLLVGVSKELKMEKSQVFLLGILFWETKISSGLTVESLYFIEDRILSSQEVSAETAYLRSMVSILWLLLSHVVLFTIMLYAFWHRIKKQCLPLRRQELCYISLIPIAGILFGQMIACLLYEIKDGEMIQLYERHPVFLAVVPLVALLFYAGTYLTIMYQQRMALLRQEQEAGFVERQQIRAIRERIHEAERFYGHIRELKHELRGHMTNIKGLIRSREYADLEEYISRMNESMSDFESTLWTGNPVTDVIVNDKRRQCLERYIRFQADFHYPETGNYDAFDMGIILQNLLQNAQEACENVAEGERYISLTGRRKGRFFLIEVNNSFAGEVTYGTDGLPVTTKKENVLMHGIGLPNVRRLARKYMGEMEISQENQEFRVTVMVQEMLQI